MSARFSNGLRVFVAFLGTVVPLAPGFVSGCSSSDSTAPAAPGLPAGSAPIQMGVRTTGGGAASSPGQSQQNPFGGLDSGTPGDDSTSDSGSSSGDDSAADSSSGNGPSDGGSDADSSSSSPPNACVNYVAPMCGTTPCDLRSNTCCISLTLETRCIAGVSASCKSTEAAVHCLQACECPDNGVCCGVDNTLVGFVESECQAVPAGGLCNPHPQTATQASEQLCKTDAECTNGQGCISQTCIDGAMLNICGLQSQDPFDCVAN
jgi:hypothetical protein